MNLTEGEETFQPDAYPFSASLISIIMGIPALLIMLPLNMLTFHTILRTKRLHNPTFFFIAYLAIIEIIFGLSSIITIIGVDISMKWIYGAIFCTWFPFVNLLFSGMELWTLICISQNRYLLVCHPSFYKLVFTRIGITCMLIFGWVFVAAVLLPPMFNAWGRFSYLPKKNLCSLDNIGDNYNTFLMMVSFCLPLATTVMSYIRIYITVYKQRQKIKEHNEASKNTKAQMTSTKDIKITKMLVCMLAIYVICYMPFAMVIIIDKTIKWPTLHRLTASFVWYFSILNNVVLITMNRNFRASMKNQMCCLKGRVTQRIDVAAFKEDGNSMSVTTDMHHTNI